MEKINNEGEIIVYILKKNVKNNTSSMKSNEQINIIHDDITLRNINNYFCNKYVDKNIKTKISNKPNIITNNNNNILNNKTNNNNNRYMNQNNHPNYLINNNDNMNQINNINSERNNKSRILLNNNNVYNANNIMDNPSNKDIKIQQLEKLLNDEKTKNKELNKKINELNSLLSEEKNKNNELNEKLNRFVEKSEFKGNYSSEINELYKVINNNNTKIEELKAKLARYPFELLPGEKMMSIIFSSLKQDVNYSIICKNTDLFVNVEVKLYKDYPEYNEGEENYFTVNGRKILKYKNLEEKNKNNNQLEELKAKLARYPFELLPGEKMMSIIFSSLKLDVHYSVICKNTDKFVNVEMKLYNDYPEYNEGEDNFFTVNGRKILKYKTLEENDIKNSDVILLNKMEID